MSDRWAFSLLAREALHNVFGRSARLWSAVLLATVFGAGAVAQLALEQAGLRAELGSLTREGMGVMILREASPEHPAEITRESCERLAGTTGVAAAGLVIPTGRVALDPITMDSASQRASASLFPDLRHVDLLVGQTLSAHAEEFRVLVDGVALQAKVPAQTRDGLGAAHQLTSPLLPGDRLAKQCVVVLDAFTRAARVMPSKIAQTDVVGNAIVAQEVMAPTSDPVGSYINRPGRWLFAALGVFGGLVTGIISRARASELAGYRLSGTSRSSLFLLLALEALCVAGVTVAASSVAGLVLAPWLFTPLTAVTGGIACATTWMLVSCATTVDLALRKPTELAKDR